MRCEVTVVSLVLLTRRARVLTSRSLVLNYILNLQNVENPTGFTIDKVCTIILL
jgi:hypothetical protein